MAVVKNMMVRAGADFSAITKQASKASNSMRGMQNSVSRSCNAMSKAAAGLKKAFTAVGVAVSLGALVSAAKDAAAAYDEQVQNEVRLAQAMRNTMSATNDEIQSVLDLADAQEQLGIIDANAQVAGAQELSTYLSTADALKELIPAMNDMAVQQYGYNVTAEQTAGIATMLGKVMEGQTGALSRYGYYFSEAEEHILKFGTEAERAATLARIVEQSVGGMNQALASTPTGRMKQLSNTLGNIKQQFGQAVRTISTVFLPVLNMVASVLAAIATLANKVAQTIANVFGGKAAGKEWKFIPQAATAASDASEATDSLADSNDNLASSTNNATKATKAAKKAQEALQQASFDTLNILKQNEEAEDDIGDYDGYSPSSLPGSSGGDTPADKMIEEINTGTEEAGEGIGWLGKLLESVKDKIADFKAGLDFSKLKAGWKELKDAVGDFASAVGGLFNSVWERILKPFGQWTINEALPAVLRVLAGAFEVLAAVIDKWLRPAFEWLWDNFLSKIASWAGEVFIKALNEIATQLQNIAKVINGEMSLGEFIAQLTPLEQIILGIVAAITAIKGAMLLVKGVEFVKEIGAWISGLGKFGGVVGEVVKGAGGLRGAFVECFGGVSTAIAGVGTVLGGLTMGISGFVSQWQNGANLASAAVTGIGVAIAAVGAVLLGAPAAVAAIVAGVVFAIAEGAALIHDHWDEIKAWGKRTAESLGDSFKETWADIKNRFAQAKTDLASDFEGIKQFGVNAWNTIRSGAQSAAEGFKSAFNNAASSIKNAFNGVKSFFVSTFNSIGSLAKAAIDKVINAFNTLKTAATNAANSVKNAFSNLSLSNIVSSVKSKVSSLNISLPHLASGAVIPPNREFAAVLGDQTSGMNIETPERLLREIVRQESGNSAVLDMMARILDAVLEGQELTVDGDRLGRVVRRSLSQNGRMTGYSVI